MNSLTTATTGFSGPSFSHTTKYADFCLFIRSSSSLTSTAQIADTLSEVLGRKIEHVKLDEESRVQGLTQAGVSEYYAKFLTRLEVLASTDFEKAQNDVVERVTGQAPKSFQTFAEENKAKWSS
jgi:hypothetical protein